MREALKVLAAEGLVRLEPRRGCFVNALTEQDLDEIFR
jgi:DNA-binding GntR family transcriptional regulator